MENVKYVYSAIMQGKMAVKCTFAGQLTRDVAMAKKVGYK